MRRWQRPHRPDIGMIVSGGLVALGGLFALCLTSGLLSSGSFPVNQAGGVLIVYAFLACWLTFAWRVNRAGVFVTGDCLRIRHVLRTRTLPWSGIARIESRPAELLGRQTIRPAIWVVTRDGTAIETPVQMSVGVDARGLTKNNGRVLQHEEYEQALRVLRRRLAATEDRAVP